MGSADLERSFLCFSFPVGKEMCKTALPQPESTTGSLMEEMSSVFQTCHSLGLPLEAGNITNKEQELVVSIHFETTNNTELYLENTFMSLFWAQNYFQTANHAFLQEPSNV